MPSSEQHSSRRTVHCVGCAHLYTTWDQHRPRGCRAFGFHTAEWPSAVVQRLSGRPCELRAVRETPGRGRTERPATTDDGLYG